MKCELELAINDLILPTNVISLMDNNGRFGSLTSIIKQ
jgi:hypothetical protein